MPSDDPQAKRNSYTQRVISARDRLAALIVTACLIVVPAAVFTALFHVPIEDKPEFLLTMIFGPYAPQILHKTIFPFEATSALWMTIPLLLYVIHPRWFTFVLAAVVAVAWFGCGVVGATGGV